VSVSRALGANSVSEFDEFVVRFVFCPSSGGGSHVDFPVLEAVSGEQTLGSNLGNWTAVGHLLQYSLYSWSALLLALFFGSFRFAR